MRFDLQNKCSGQASIYGRNHNRSCLVFVAMAVAATNVSYFSSLAYANKKCRRR